MTEEDKDHYFQELLRAFNWDDLETAKQIIEHIYEQGRSDTMEGGV